MFPAPKRLDRSIRFVNRRLVALNRVEDGLQLRPRLRRVGLYDRVETEQLRKLVRRVPEHKATGCHALQVSVGQRRHRARSLRMGDVGGKAYGNLGVRQPSDQARLVGEDELPTPALIEVLQAMPPGSCFNSLMP